MTVSVVVRQWAAWSTACSSRQEWEDWFKDGVQRDPQAPDISFLPPIQRRRLSLLTKMGLWLAHECLDGQSDMQNVPSVFSSRYGEYDRTFGLLQDLATDQEVSPAAFSQSVHNTTSGLMSIFFGNKGASTVVSAGASSLEAGFLETALQAAEVKGRDVLYVHQDTPLPAQYDEVGQSNIEGPIGLGLLVRAAEPGDKNVWHLSWRPNGQEKKTSHGPASRIRDIVKSLIIGQGGTRFDDGRLLWTWSYG